MRRLIAVVSLLLVLPACAPSLSPLYRDYAVADTAEVYPRLRAALTDAGWQLAGEGPPGAVATEERVVSRWGLYRVVVTLEAVPVGTGHVRVFVHPYRRYFTGNRSKIPFLRPGLRRSLLPALNEALEARGMQLLGTELERNQLIGGP